MKNLIVFFSTLVLFVTNMEATQKVSKTYISKKRVFYKLSLPLPANWIARYDRHIDPCLPKAADIAVKSLILNRIQDAGAL